MKRFFVALLLTLCVITSVAGTAVPAQANYYGNDRVSREGI